MNSVKSFFNHLKVYFINFFFYKIRPTLKKIKKKQFINKYKISFSENKFVLPQDNRPLPLDYLDLNNLVNQILKLKPQCVLELGTGYSTYAIIFALNKLKEDIGHKFKFYAIDQNEEYLENSKKLIPENLSKQIDFRYRPIYVKEYNNTLMSFFKNLPKEKFDYIYEDRKDPPETKVAGDILEYEHSLNHHNVKFSFTIDGMMVTRNYYKKNLKGNYKISGSLIHGTNFDLKN
tara:strand:- start:344 stop:1042 length:699 start_codon:yes stop_codon:yes gene_type:complete